MSAPAPQALLAGLEEDLERIAALVADGQPEAASALLGEHQARLEDYLALPDGSRDLAALQDLSRRHAGLLATLGEARERAAARLRQYRASRHAAAAYQVAGRL